MPRPWDGMSWSSKNHGRVAGAEPAREKLLPLRIKLLKTLFLLLFIWLYLVLVAACKLLTVA